MLMLYVVGGLISLYVLLFDKIYCGQDSSGLIEIVVVAFEDDIL